MMDCRNKSGNDKVREFYFLREARASAMTQSISHIKFAAVMEVMPEGS